MNRDETVALFLKCEAERSEAVKRGMHQDEAHAAAKAHWNSWAKGLLEERRELKLQGDWDLLERKAESRSQWFQRHNPKMKSWLLRARADFSRCQIVLDRSVDATSSPLIVSGPWIDFREFIFPGEADFTEARLMGITFFDRAAFYGPAWFRSLQTINAANFNGAVFHEQVWFRQANFLGSAHFHRAHFKKPADFVGLTSHSFFEMDGVVFEQIPDFIQAHFEEAPRLDNLTVIESMVPPHPIPEREVPKTASARCWRSISFSIGRIRTWPGRITRGIWRRVSDADRDAPARWRALKRLAIQGHDTDRELEFFSGEVRSARFAGDWPLPWPVWNGRAWSGFLRFWSGLLYQVLSNFGRSLIKPLLAWALCIVIFAIYFLGQNKEMMLRRDPHFSGIFVVSKEYARSAWKALRSPPYCYPGTPPRLDEPAAPGRRPDDVQTGFSGLVEEIRGETDLVNEALSIAYHNAVIILDSSGDSAHRAFGCLYGVERYGGNPVAYVPRSVAIASGIQKLLSAIFIFLFGLAVRNMLKMK
jgi:hypothetical protein